MPFWLRYRIDIANAQSEKRELRNHYRKLRAEVREQDPKGDVDNLIHEEMGEIDAIDDHIGFITSQYWKEKAEYYLLPISEFDSKNGVWVQGQHTGRWRLSVDEVAKLRSAVRKEQKESREGWQVWFTLGIGFMGTLIGLVSLLKK
jgi:hypothetical protein